MMIERQRASTNCFATLSNMCLSLYILDGSSVGGQSGPCYMLRVGPREMIRQDSRYGRDADDYVGRIQTTFYMEKFT